MSKSVFVGEQPVLLYCPQGLDKKVLDYDNIFPNMYKIGASFDPENAKMVDVSQLQNMDYGFEAMQLKPSTLLMDVLLLLVGLVCQMCLIHLIA